MRVPVRRKPHEFEFIVQITALGLLLVTSASGQDGSRQVRSYGKYKEEVPARPNTIWEEESHSQPHFDNSTTRNVTTQLAKTAFLNCRVRNLGERLVSWIRYRDLHVLTVGRYTYTTDQRFQAIHVDNTDDWTLQIKYPQKRDSGVYECQISTEPKMSTLFNLNVVDEPPVPARKIKSKKGGQKPNKQSGRSSNKSQRSRHTDVATASIRGGPEMYIKSGSTINLTCDVSQGQHPQLYVFWHHNDRVINYDSPRGGISVETTSRDVSKSRLLIRNARPTDSGNYTCEPSNADTDTIVVHVLNGEKPGALQHGDQNDSRHVSPRTVLVLISLLLTCYGTLIVR